MSHISCFEEQLVVYNVHLESRGNDELRCCQLIEILRDVHQYNPDAPVVIAGDFNLDLSREPFASIIENVMFNSSFKNVEIRKTTTRSRLGRARAIDWILVRGCLNDAVPEVHDSVRASDHYPLSITFLRN